VNKQQLANKIWESANKMRSKIEANEYKDYILGFIFYKFLSDKEVEYLKSIGATDTDIKEITEDDTDTVKNVQQNIGYFIAYKNLFSTWLTMGKDFDVSNVMDALSSFTFFIDKNHKKVFEKIFTTLQTGLGKLGDSSGAQTKAISGLLDLIKDIPMDGKQDYDVLGFIYEYLISMFAANAGKKAGEFYTPHEVSLLMSEIVAHHVKDRNAIKIYDPTSGSGSLLINIGRSVAKHIDDANNIKYYAQEIKENTYNLTRMNLVMRGILPDNIVTRNGDTLEEDWPYFDESDPQGTYEPLFVDAVVSNPPYSQNWDPMDKDGDPRFASFGLAPKSKADYAFLLHDLYHLRQDGIMTIVLPHGVLFRGGEEGKIRRNLIEGNYVDTIIGLPANIFFGTGIPTIIVVLKKQRENTDILIVDASKGFIKEGKSNKLRASDIKRIADTVIQRINCPKYSKVVTRDEIRANDYNLNIPRYVDSSEPSESWDIYASMFGGVPDSELNNLAPYWNAFPSLKGELFKNVNAAYMSLASEDIKKTINNNKDVVEFEKRLNTAFADLPQYLHNELIDHMDSLTISREEDTLSNNIFRRLDGIMLVDNYDAYQLLDDSWTQIAGDLELIQTEGMAAITQVDPKMVTKTKNGKDEEVQDGWRGHVLPFVLVQENLLKTELEQLNELNNKLSSISANYEEALENLSEEDKDSEAVNEDKTAFVNAYVTKKAKTLKAEISKGAVYADDTLEATIVKVSKLIAEEKELKKEIKKSEGELQAKTIKLINTLSVEQQDFLLVKKWIEPLTAALGAMPRTIVDELTAKTQALANKYAFTCADVDKEISETETELSEMIDALEGNEFDMKGLEAFKALLKGE